MTLILPDRKSIPLLPELAVAVGVNDALILQQVHYWCEYNKSRGQNKKDGFYWVYNSIAAWNEEFAWMGEKGLEAAFKRLRRKKLLVTGRYNEFGFDKKLWYRVNYDVLNQLLTEKGFSAVSADKIGESIPLQEGNDTPEIGESIPLQEGNPLPPNRGIDAPTKGEPIAIDNPLDNQKIEKEIHNTNKDVLADIPYNEIMTLYNNICKSLSPCISMTETRKAEIKGTWMSGRTLKDFETIFENAEKSEFLTGHGEKKWKASFDWLIKADNAIKVLEGAYDTKQDDKKGFETPKSYLEMANERRRADGLPPIKSYGILL